ncbi:MAG TPA: hypothetical protein DEB06_11380 [Phycisphaerales bacterium]|nr:hypothetical protein [Phycisphaerales bacterium]
MLGAMVLVLALLSTSAVALGLVLRSLNIQLRKQPIEARDGLKFHTLPSSFPTDRPRWVQEGADEIMSAEGIETLGTSNYVSRWYRKEDGTPGERAERVQLHCAYYTGMIDTVPHVPERCIVGGGMEIAGPTRAVRVPLDLSRLVPDPDQRADDPRGRILMGRSVQSLSRVRLPRGIENLEMMITPFRDRRSERMIYAGYFFIANGGVVGSANDVRLLAFRLEDDYAYYAKVQFMSVSADSAEALAKTAAEVLDDLLPDIMRRVPDWTEVEEGTYPPGNPRAEQRAGG